MTNRTYYDRAIAYMAIVPYVCVESIELISHLFEVKGRIVADDIAKARKGEYTYASH
jgi:hypothetical protein